MVDNRVLVGFFFRVLVQIVIPAHLNSGRFPEKVLKSLAGKTILQNVWDRACKAGFDNAPVVATDSNEVADCAVEFGAQVVMTSKKPRCGSERVLEVAQSIKADLYINLQADEALVDPKMIAALPDCFLDSQVNMVTAVVPMTTAELFENPSIVKAVLDSDNNVMYFSRSPIPYGLSFLANVEQAVWYGHLGVYAFRPAILQDVYSRPKSELEKAEGLEQLRVLQAGYSIKALIWQNCHFGINTEEDLERVRLILESNKT